MIAKEEDVWLGSSLIYMLFSREILVITEVYLLELDHHTAGSNVQMYNTCQMQSL